MGTASFQRVLAAACAPFAFLAAGPVALASGVDPVSVEVHTQDAERFAQIFLKTDGKPSAVDLHAGYLQDAGDGVAVFIPGRIVDAHNLARTVEANPESYKRAIDVCLPLAQASTPQLRATYLAMSALFPTAKLPEVHMVFGAGNSGGTANQKVQVIGLEVLCSIASTPDEVKEQYRSFFAHETVHSLQMQWQADFGEGDPLLAAALWEGVPDYVAQLVTGLPMSLARGSWAEQREAQLWAEFQHDRQRLKELTSGGGEWPKEADALFHRWFANYENAPPDWPHEVGYWIGSRIAAAYVEKHEDRRAALQRLVKAAETPQAILNASGYAPAETPTRKTLRSK